MKHKIGTFVRVKDFESLSKLHNSLFNDWKNAVAGKLVQITGNNSFGQYYVDYTQRCIDDHDIEVNNIQKLRKLLK